MLAVDTEYGEQLVMTKVSEARIGGDMLKHADFPLKILKVYTGWAVFGRTGYNVLEARRSFGDMPNYIINAATKKVAFKLAQDWNRKHYHG